MLRLVKGAYWDSEIKRAQVDGLEGFPVFTRKIHTDVSYLACARRLLGGARRGLSAIRHPQRADAGDDPCDGRRELLRRTVRVPVPARHGRAALQPDRRRRARRPAVPRLRAGRLARDAARLSGAPPAGERRQHLVRQPHRRRRRAGRRRCSTIPVEAARALGPIGAPHPKIAAAARSLRARARRIPPASTSATRRISPRSAKRSRASAASGLARRRLAAAAARRDRSIPPIRATSSARSSTPTRATSSGVRSAPRARRRPGARAAAASARDSSPRRPRFRGQCARARWR